MANIRTPHNITLLHDDGTGTPGTPHYSAFCLEGMKIDEISARMVAQYGYSADDKARVIIYLRDVRPREGWEVAVGDYFIPGLVDVGDVDITALKKAHTVYKVTNMTTKTVGLPILHHIELTGR